MNLHGKFFLRGRSPWLWREGLDSMFRAQVSKWLRHAAEDDDSAAAPTDSRTARELGCLELIAEDFTTHCRDPFQPGFWAICVHRLGSRIGDARAPAVRRVGDGAYATLSTLVDWAWGIHIPRTVELGRRVRLWHNGGMVLRARSIGNDVHIRQVTTFGPARDDTAESPSLPVIGDRADIGAGACVVGGITVGHDSVVGANSVVVQDVPPRMVVLGAPARAIPLWSVSAKSVPDGKPCDHTGLPPGDRDENPAGISLPALLREDLRTHGGSLASPGFWALAVHRMGNWRMGVRSRVARAPLTLLYRVAHQAVVAMWGIDLPYNARVGRRLRIEHHGALFIGASQIGDDVHIRGPVTVGLRRREVLAAPTIGDRVELQPNACVVGSLHLGDDSLIGAHAVVARDVRPGSTVFGIPGQCVDPTQCFQPARASAGARPRVRAAGGREAPRTRDRRVRAVIGLGDLIELLREDFATHGRSLASPGFWAIAAHRFGGWAEGVRPRPACAGLGIAHGAMATSVDWLWGIRIGRGTRLGRRVRIWHHGAMVLDAVSIGDDVQIRHNTTLGVARGRDVDGRPVVEDRVDLGAGACVLGAVTVGHDVVVDANAVVLKSCPAGARMAGVPARAAEPRRAGGPDVARVEVAAARVEVARVDAPRLEVARVDVSRADVSRVDVSRLTGYPVKPPSMTSV
jgi:serine O-acetyltransferase